MKLLLAVIHMTGYSHLQLHIIREQQTQNMDLILPIPVSVLHPNRHCWDLDQPYHTANAVLHWTSRPGLASV